MSEPSRELSPLERAARGAMGHTGGGATPIGGLANQMDPEPPDGPLRSWQKATGDELAALAKAIEDLRDQLTPYLMPQSDTEALPKAATASSPRSELVAWIENTAMAVKLMRAEVERISERLEV